MRELPRRRYVEVPAGKERVERAEVAANDPDVGVFVTSPRTADVEVERVSAAHPPPERSRRERLDNRLETERFPGTELRRWHHLDRTAPLPRLPPITGYEMNEKT